MSRDCVRLELSCIQGGGRLDPQREKLCNEWPGTEVYMKAFCIQISRNFCIQISLLKNERFTRDSREIHSRLKNLNLTQSGPSK